MFQYVALYVVRFFYSQNSGKGGTTITLPVERYARNYNQLQVVLERMQNSMKFSALGLYQVETKNLRQTHTITYTDRSFLKIAKSCLDLKKL